MTLPTPFEILLDPLSLIILAMYAILIIWEATFPARKLPKMRLWKLKGMIFFAFFFFLSSYLPLITDPFLSRHQLVDLSGLGTIAGAIFGILIYELGAYAYHWSLHRYDFLWRSLHQMHHSSERLDTYSAFIFSPLDMVGWTLLGSMCFALFMGLSPKAITAILLMTNFFAIFQHSNIKTPSWLGYIIQRPESHTIHHAMGIHKYNYSDLPFWDMIFGTFYNPRGYEANTGFYKGASNRIIDMLMFKDVAKPENENDHPVLIKSDDSKISA